MTLFEAIRELKEGQAIEERIPGGPWRRAIVWEHKGECPCIFAGYIDGRNTFRIVDLPKPKMSLEEAVIKVASDKGIYLLQPLYRTCDFCDALRSLPIDWQAEADRKEGSNA